MLAASHILAGAAIAKKVRQPWLALPTAFASHFVLDMVPHMDSHGLFGVNGAGPTRMEVISSGVDAVLGIALLFWAISKQQNRLLLVLGGLCGALVDLVYNVPLWGAWFQTWPGTSWLGEFHSLISHPVGPTDWLIGFGTQVLVMAIALYLLLQRPETKETR